MNIVGNKIVISKDDTPNYTLLLVRRERKTRSSPEDDTNMEVVLPRLPAKRME